MNRLVLATHNKHKVEELQALLVQALLGATGIEILTLDALPNVGEVDEDGDTLEANALKKARAVFRLTNLPSLADDTGLEVFSLNGAPGVLSARYAGEHATYADNCRKLLAALKDSPPHDRGAQFRCVLAFVAPNQVERVVEGVCPGMIIAEPRGTGGFGYDPIFLPDGYGETLAEMSMELKNTLSHRGKALRKITSVLRGYTLPRL